MELKTFEKIYESCRLEEAKSHLGGTWERSDDIFDPICGGIIQVCNRCDKKYFGTWDLYCPKCWKIVDAEYEEKLKKEYKEQSKT
jgi:hypothetical protein